MDHDAVLTEEPRQNSPPEGERPAEHATGRRWVAPTRPKRAPDLGRRRIESQVQLLTILAEAALENEQIDKAMAAMGIVQNLKKEENVVVAPGGGSKSVRMGLAQTARRGILAGESKTKVRCSGEPLEPGTCPSPRRGNQESRQPGTCGTCWVSSGNHRWISRSNATFSKSNHTGRTAVRLVRFWTTKWKLHRDMSSSRWKDARINWQDGILAMTRRNWDGKPNQQQTPPNGRSPCVVEKDEEAPEKEKHQNVPVQILDKSGREVHGFSLKRTQQEWRMKCMPVGWVARMD